MDAFEKLDVWQRNSRLCADLYQTLDPRTDRVFKSRITSAALSIPSNIAEGYERNSVNEYRRFLKIAKGSCGELRTRLYIRAAADLLGKEQAMRFIRKAIVINKMIQALITALAR